MTGKVVVLGLDGLEASIIEEYRFPNLCQIEYGRVRVPIAPHVNEPSTPVVWISFLTGKPPSEHGIKRAVIYDNPFIDFVFRHTRNPTMRRLILKFNRVRHLLESHGLLKKHMPRRSELKTSTLFDTVKPSIGIDIPILHKDVDIKYAGLIDAILGKNRAKYLSFLVQDYKNVRNQLLKALNREYRLVMAHFSITDLYGHIYCKELDRIVQLYWMMDKMVYDVTRKLRQSRDLLLILSDHGINTRYGHTPYGFYSVNHKLGLRNPHITTFYNIIIEWCKR